MTGRLRISQFGQKMDPKFDSSYEELKEAADAENTTTKSKQFFSKSVLEIVLKNDYKAQSKAYWSERLEGVRKYRSIYKKRSDPINDALLDHAKKTNPRRNWKKHTRTG